MLKKMHETTDQPFDVMNMGEEESLPVYLQHIGPHQKKNLNPVPPERRTQHRHQPNGNAASIFWQGEDQEIGSSSELFSRPSANRPDVIIEEFMKESESAIILQSPENKASKATQKMQSKTNIHHGQVFQEWVFVTHVANPNHFYIRRVAEKRAGVLLARKINTFCSGERRFFVSDDDLVTGSTVFVRWKENVWYRAVLTEIFKNEQDKPVNRCSASTVSKVHVFFQDYGFSEQVSLSVKQDDGTDPVVRLNQQLRKLDLMAQSVLRCWVPQAIKCSLKDIVPADPIKGWDQKAQAEFWRVVGTKAVPMQVFGQDNDTLLVDLKNAPMDKSATNMPVSLREYLVFLDLARFYSPLDQDRKMVSGAKRSLQFYPPVLPNVGVQFCAVVCHINSPSDFYIQMQVDNAEFLLLNAKLQECYSQDIPKRQGVKVSYPLTNQACVAMFEDKVWYRAQIIGFPGGRQVEVRYVDFGNKKSLPLDDVCCIKEEFLALPAMAIHCCLADVEPLPAMKMWSEECSERFHNLVGQKLMSTVVTEVNQAQQILLVRLLELNSISNMTMSSDIGELLVKEGLASFLSGVTLDKEPLSSKTTIWDPPFESPLEVTEADISSENTTEHVFEVDLHSERQLCASELRVRVTHVTSPASFFVQFLQMDSSLKRVYKMLKEEYALSKPLPEEWKAQMYCAALINGVWERGQICSVSSNNVAEVLRCDFGGKVKLQLNNLRPLRHHLIGSLVLECSLCDIRPTGGGTTWTVTACEFISYYLTGALAIMTVKDKAQQPVSVALYCHSKASQEVSFADVMVSAGLALKERRPDVVSVKTSEGSDQQGSVSMGENQRPLCCMLSGLLEELKTEHYSPPKLPQCGLVQMTITAVSEDGAIYAMTQEAEQHFVQLKRTLRYVKSLPRQKPYNWKHGQGCAVMGSDVLWYRAEVLEVIGGHIKVRYVDQGLVENIPECYVYPMLLSKEVPQLSVPCQLHGVIPVGGVWQRDAVELLKELLHMRYVNMQIMEVPVDPRGHLTVQIVVDGIDLSKFMVHHQHAIMRPIISKEKDNMEVYVIDHDNWDWDVNGMEYAVLQLKRYTYPRMPEKGQCFPVQITHLCTPNEVFLSPLLDMEDFVEDSEENLEEALAYVNEMVDRLQPLSDFAIGSPCLAKYSDGQYYRAKILSIKNYNPVQILVRHVDFGSDDTLSTQKLRQIPSELLQYPCKAIKVRVTGLRPPHVSLEKERVSYSPEWSIKAVLEMIDLLHGKITACVMSTGPEIAVMLYNDVGALVHRPLIEKGLAEED
ncbi:RING finger protein 17 isoform X1 [Brienomyrus brachyistius]|uniref:RING finger protein 17 isoform X1 n=2 Tax=Brienomyrus brachyistius TaxID=42636 RepID=UPI0020B2A550|nr:RING finger protein 17 isoform X1 [Brienomyrus brachyistius]XP_048878282.1 RING finger protein 17 isoform X1 [Brienomyrus brachyistius]